MNRKAQPRQPIYVRQLLVVALRVDFFSAGTAVAQHLGCVCFAEAIKSKIIYSYMKIKKNNGTPKSSILIGFSIINHPFWAIPIFGNIHLYTRIRIFFKVLFFFEWKTGGEGAKVVLIVVLWRSLTERALSLDGQAWFPVTQVQAMEGVFGDKSHVGVSKNRGTPKWMVYNGKPY